MAIADSDLDPFEASYFEHPYPPQHALRDPSPVVRPRRPGTHAPPPFAAFTPRLVASRALSDP